MQRKNKLVAASLALAAGWFASAAAAQAADLPTFLQLYPAGSDAQAAQSAEQLEGDFSIKNDAGAMAGLQHQTGRSPVYVYNFNFTSAYTPVAAHTTEVPYVFGNLVPGLYQPGTPSSADIALSASVQGYWTNFARTGNPNGAALPTWPTYTGAGGQALLIGAAVAAGPEDGTARFEFLNDNFRGADGLFTIGMH